MTICEKPAAEPCGMDLLTGLVTRRSIRKFTEEPVTEAQLKLIAQAGLCAPSARNRRPFELVVLQKRETLEKLAQINAHAPMLGTAAAAIVVCGNDPAEHHPQFLEQVCGAVLENILLAAHGLGLGAVWCGVLNDTDWQADLSALLNLPAGIRPRGVVAIGHPDQQPEERDYWTPEKLHLEQW